MSHQVHPLAQYARRRRASRVEVEDSFWVDWEVVDTLPAAGAATVTSCSTGETAAALRRRRTRTAVPASAFGSGPSTYAHGGGARARRRRAIRGGRPRGRRVANPLPTRRRGRRVDRRRRSIASRPSSAGHDRAVTAADFREQAKIPGVGRAECLPRFDPATKAPRQRASSPCRLAARGPAPPRRAAAGRHAARRGVRAARPPAACDDRAVRRPAGLPTVAVSVGLGVKQGYGAIGVRRWVELVLRQYLSPLPPLRTRRRGLAARPPRVRTRAGGRRAPGRRRRVRRGLKLADSELGKSRGRSRRSRRLGGPGAPGDHGRRRARAPTPGRDRSSRPPDPRRCLSPCRRTSADADHSRLLALAHPTSGAALARGTHPPAPIVTLASPTPTTSTGTASPLPSQRRPVSRSTPRRWLYHSVPERVKLCHCRRHDRLAPRGRRPLRGRGRAPAGNFTPTAAPPVARATMSLAIDRTTACSSATGRQHRDHIRPAPAGWRSSWTRAGGCRPRRRRRHGPLRDGRPGRPGVGGALVRAAAAGRARRRGKRPRLATAPGAARPGHRGGRPGWRTLTGPARRRGRPGGAGGQSQERPFRSGQQRHRPGLRRRGLSRRHRTGRSRVLPSGSAPQPTGRATAARRRVRWPGHHPRAGRGHRLLAGDGLFRLAVTARQHFLSRARLAVHGSTAASTSDMGRSCRGLHSAGTSVRVRW